MTEVVYSSKTLVFTFRFTLRYRPEDIYLHIKSVVDMKA